MEVRMTNDKGTMIYFCGGWIPTPQGDEKKVAILLYLNSVHSIEAWSMVFSKRQINEFIDLYADKSVDESVNAVRKLNDENLFPPESDLVAVKTVGLVANVFHSTFSIITQSVIVEVSSLMYEEEVNKNNLN